MLLPRLTFAAPVAQVTPVPTETVVPEDAPIFWLRTSPEIVELPPIDPDSYALVFPGDFATPALMLAAYATRRDILLMMDGSSDFASGTWADWDINNMSGTADRYRTIRAFNIEDDYIHPYSRIGGNEALIGAVSFRGTSSYWIVSGGTQRGLTTMNDVLGSAHHIVYDRMLVQNQLSNYGFQARGGDGCVVQRSCLIDPGVGGGLIGISLDPQSTAGISGFKCLDNEVRNYKDGYLHGRYDPAPTTDVDALVEGNDFYNDESFFEADGTCPFENGMDIKGSSSTVQSISRRNRIRNMRQCGSSRGDAFEAHRQCRNWLSEDDFYDNCQEGFFESAQDAGTDPDTPRDMVVRRLRASRIRNYANFEEGGGAVFRIISNWDIADSWFSDSDGVVYVPATGIHAGGPVFNDNERTSTPVVRAGSYASPYVENDNTVGDPSAVREYIQCNRWTGPILVRGPRTGAVQGPREPVAAFSVERTAGLVEITAEDVVYGGATIVSYLTDFGDGTTSTAAEPSHTYTSNDPYTITRTITDSEGLTHTTQRSVHVSGLTGRQLARVRESGPLMKNQTGGTPTPPSTFQPGEVALCVCVTQGTQPPTTSNAHGFEQLDGTPFAVPDSPFDVGLASGSAMYIALRRIGIGETVSDWAPTFNDSGDHHIAQVHRLDRCDDAASILDIINALAVSIITSASTDVDIPGLTTDEDNCLILGFATTGADDDTPDFADLATVAPHITGTVELVNEGTSLGNGSGLWMLSGSRPTAGAVGGWSGTLPVTFRQIRVAIAILGAEP